MAKEAGPGFPSVIEEKPVGYHDKPCSIWQRLPYNPHTGGVSPMWLEGREAYMVERMRGMTPERRAHRKQFLEDQVLTSREPVYIRELHTELNNPIRRLGRWPLDKIYKFWEPKVDQDVAKFFRRNAKHWFNLIWVTYTTTYLCLFYYGDWKSAKKTSIHRSKPVVFPGDQDFPYTSDKFVGEDYYDLGWRNSSLYKSEEQIRAEYAAEKLKK